MWATVLLLAIWMATNDPFRLVVAGFLVTRERPLPNLIAYWVGGAGGSIVACFAVIFFLRDVAAAPMHAVTSTVSDMTGGYVRIALGIIALLFAARFAAQMSWHQPVGMPMDAVSPSVVALQPRTSPIEQLQTLVHRLIPPAVSRYSTRIWASLGSASPRVAFVAGLVTAMPAIELQAALTTILASHQSLGAQLGASVMFVLVVMASLEAILIGYLVAPQRTKNGIARVQNFNRAIGRKLFPFIAGAGGVMLIFSGVGGI